ncbi:MAG: S41 family peptidase [Prevotellaceae bacterium]|nr:S41 family peptidase [Prevotellaceae bacterium]
MKKLILSSILIFTIYTGNLYAQSSQDFKLNKNVDIFFSALRELRSVYVDSLNIDDLFHSSIEGMISKLDPYTTFVPEEEAGEFDFMTTGRYGGIGALIQKDSNYVRIAEPYKGFPAQQAGLVAGDRLIQIDGQDLKDADINSVSNMLKGNPGTTVELKAVKLRGSDTVSLKLKRQRIHVSGIVYAGIIDDGIGYIRLTSFTEDCSRDFRDALTNLRKTGDLKSLIIDLRSNGGGLFEESIKIVNFFVPKGTEVVSARGREKSFEATYLTKDQSIDTQIPIAVLVNSATASSSEVVSGAIQDLDRGIIVGTRTFGKGYIQAIRPTGYNTKMKITSAKYYIPSGRCIQAHNFSQLNSDGSVAFIPDSLKKEFKTKTGRKVFDGGGIDPDIKVESEEYSRIAVSLVSRNLIFEYSLKYYKEHLAIVEPKDFKITNEDYADFVNFLFDKTYDYQTTSERIFKQLTEAVKNEKYDSETKIEMDALSEKLKHDKLKDLQIFKPEISQLLEAEIVNRYYYQEGRVCSMLRNDIQLDSAVKVLKNPVEYNNILSKQ